MYKGFMKHEVGRPSPIVTEPIMSPRYTSNPNYDRDGKHERTRKRFDNGTLSGKELTPSQEVIRCNANSANSSSSAIRMHATYLNFQQAGLFPKHRASYIGNTTEHGKLEMLIAEHFSARPLILSVDFEWSTYYDPEEHP